MSPSLPPASTLFALADELEALMDEAAGELHAIEWDDLNEYEIKLRTAANILSGVSVESYLAEMQEWARKTIAATRDELVSRRSVDAP